MNQGLAGAAQQVQAMGRGPDTMLAHISPDEAQFIDYMQGGRRTNPTTGLPEYGLFGSILKAVARVAGAVGGFMVGGPLGAAAGSGAATKLTGGSWKDALKGAALSGIGGELAQGLSGAGWSPVGASSASAAGSAAGAGVAGTAAGTTGGAAGIASVTASEPLAAAASIPLGGTALSAAAPAVAAPTGLAALAAHVGGYGGLAAGMGALSTPLAGHGATDPTPAAPTDGIHLNDVVPLHRNQLPYTGDIEHYGETGGGEHQFFDEVNPPTQYYAPTTSDATPKVFAGGGPVFGLQQPVMTMRGIRGGGIQQPNFGQEGGPGGGGINAPQSPGLGSHAGDLRRAAILGYAQAGGATGMARGGMVHGPSMMPRQQSIAVRGPGGGMDDAIHAQLSDGERIITAQDISYAGDGSNDAGQKVYQRIAEEIRAQAGQKNPKKPSNPVGLMVARAKKRAGVK